MKKCTRCSESKELSQFYHKKRSKVRTDGSIHSWVSTYAYCKQCHYSVSKTNLHKYTDYYKNYRVLNKEKAAEASKKWYIETKQKWWAIIATNKTLQCIKCGYHNHSAGLDFHHIDPDKKESTINMLMNGPAPNDENIKVFLEELEKCEVLCATCHRETHAKYNFLNKEP